VAEGGQRHPVTGRRDDVHLVERFRTLRELRRDLHHDAILVHRVVDGRHLALAECVVERLRHGRHLDSELASRLTIDFEADLLAGDQFVLDPGQLGKRFERFPHALRPHPQLGHAVGSQRVLV
jgi:hypothetical protein